MNTRLLSFTTLSLVFGIAVLAAEPGPASGTGTGATAVVAAAQPASQTSTNAEPTEAEMREAVQRHLDGLNAQMRPPPAPPSTGRQPAAYTYSPYWRPYYGYYQKYSKESDYENWTDVARRANAHARIEITSFKKIRCTPAPDEGGFLGEYVAELELRGNNPAAQEVMKTSGQRLKGFFYRGDKGWIFGEARAETK